MFCPKCKTDNPESAKYCNNCGKILTLVDDPLLIETDHATLLQKYIPPELAKKILSAGAQIESERRLVTVIFADVSGFTAMSEKLDAEDVTTVINDCFKGLISIVYKYEGVIDKFIGDEIMAIFGAPLTHENDPERAIRCAMEMMEYMDRFNQLSPITLPEPLGIHIAMNTGMVVAGNVGSDLRMNYSVIGDTVNLASRLKHVAEKGEIVVSEETYRIISSLINTEAPKQIEIKGKNEPAKVYKIKSLKEGIEPGTRITQKNPIIGREQEIATLKASLEKVAQKKEQRDFIRGEAGVGKTRLKLELIEQAKSKNITVYEGKCSSFEINTPYYLWTTLLKDILQLKSDTGESETKKRLHDMLQILSLEKQEPYLATLLSLRYEEILLEEDQKRKKKIFESLKEFIRALSKRKPSLFLLEDVHWIDRFSQDMLMYLFNEQELAPALFVPLFRDEYKHSKELIEKGGSLIDLNRLTLTDAMKLIYARLNVKIVPTQLSDLIYKRSEGNPFFIEELIKTLLDKNVVSVKNQKLEILKSDFESILPATVQGVIMARIDRLEEKLKDVLYGASVIGREFDKTLLMEILKKKEAVGPSLQELLTLEMILEKEEAKELAYLFKHYLIQEVAYNTILQKKRRELHKLIAHAIEKVYADKLKEFYELLSFHYEKAEEWEKAASFLSMSGRKVKEMYSAEESKGFYERKTEAVEKLYSSGPSNRPVVKWLIRIAAIVYIFPICIAMVMTFPVLIYKMLTSTKTIPIEILTTLTVVAVIWIPISIMVTVIIFFGLYNLSFRKGPALYEVMEDHIVVRKPNGNEFKVHYSELVSVLWWTNSGLSISFPEYLKLIFSEKLFQRVYSYALYASLPMVLLRDSRSSPNGGTLSLSAREGMTFLMKKSGISSVKVMLTPWNILNPEKAISIGLTTSNPLAFHEQLSSAFDMWRKKNATEHYAPSTGESTPILTVSPHYDVRNIVLGSMFINIVFFSLAILMNILMVFKPLPHSLVPQLWIGLQYFVVNSFAAWITYSLFSMKRCYASTRYEFYSDKMKYIIGFTGTQSGEIYYRDITMLSYAANKRLSWFELGAIEIVTSKPFDLLVGSNKRSALYLFDISNAEEHYQKIRELVFGNRKAEIQ